MDITNFPTDLFVLILGYLSPKELVLSRCVSKKYHAAFTDPDLSHHMLLHHYPRVRELRYETASLGWADIFAKVARRYHHLQTGTPRRIESYPLCKSFVVPKWARSYPINPWQRHLQFEEKSAPFQYHDTLWTYDEGLLIFPSQEKQRYVLYDLETSVFSNIDIGSEGNIVRRIRLKNGVLVVEWCEGEAYHALNENEMVYRHFATSFNIIKIEGDDRWTANFR